MYEMDLRELYIYFHFIFMLLILLPEQNNGFTNKTKEKKTKGLMRAAGPSCLSTTHFSHKVDDVTFCFFPVRGTDATLRGDGLNFQKSEINATLVPAL